MSAMKVLNMAKCLELLEVDMSPAGRGPPAAGHKLLLTKIAQVVKVSPTTIEIVPNSNSFSTPILQRVNRFDGTLQVSKENNTIKVVMQPVTTAQRDKAVEDIKHQISFFKNKVKQSRNNAGRVLQECGLEEQALAELTQGLDATMRSFVDENCIELESLAESVMTMGLDESDNAV
ncbi:ribosome recycling factor [Angomonas deanei]|uniref:Ribosome recycling factor, putative n=1 Tax=Angomonas deanei TaxID=59799 RepID=S9VN05_9TRYP|nr:ribosome recycling factor [Angomonas deanei]EPY42179.1 ribosome recycling factor [Angomonas deanei]CAD2218265.1 Ribosome recycling factor, putative [Angomonas deanei]|eukprot:EPY40114.1 ribosome recycling factor [Angomonas deanei]